jgi:adenylate cyclase class 2
MHPEIEIKLAVHDPRPLRRRLAELGFRRASKRQFERNLLYDFPDRRLRKEGSLVRLRFAGARSLVTFKGRQVRPGRFKERPEIESRVSDGLEMGRLLEGLGLRVAFRYEKYRTLYRRPRDSHHHEVTLDETPIGIYVEVEGPRRWIDQVAGGLGYRPRDYISASYGGLYLEWCEAHGWEPADMVFGGIQVGDEVQGVQLRHSPASTPG